jgi:hypothetical protein
VCGKESEETLFYTIQIDGNDLADYVFDQLISKGFAPKMKEVNMILDIVDDYMTKGVLEDEQD